MCFPGRELGLPFFYTREHIRHREQYGHWHRHWGLGTPSVGDQDQLGAGGGYQIRQDLLGHHVEIGLFLEAQGEDLGV